MITFIAALILLGVLIAIHEYGHFIVARMCGVYVQRFSIGMGPVIFKRLDKKGTEFALSALPLGGYCAMLSQKALDADPDTTLSVPKDQLKNTFESQPKWQRALIMLAGPFANFLLAIFLFSFISFTDIHERFSFEISEISSDNVVLETSIQPGQRLIAINNYSISSPDDLNKAFMDLIGTTGPVNLQLIDLDNREFTETIYVTNFLSLKEDLENVKQALGFSFSAYRLPFVGKIESHNAQDSDLKVNDLIVSIDSFAVKRASDIRSIIDNVDRDTVQIEVIRDNQTLFFDVPLTIRNDQDGAITRYIGIELGYREGLISSFFGGFQETYTYSYLTLAMIGKLITGNASTEFLSGPVGIVKAAGDSARNGLLAFLKLMALLSVSLGILNLLPIPVLDGGQLTMLGIEAIKGSPLPEKVENSIFAGGWILVMGLMFFAIYNDVAKLF